MAKGWYEVVYRRVVAAGLSVLAFMVVLVGGATTAGAQTYPPPPVGITATPFVVPIGGSVTAVAFGFLPDSEVAFTLFSDPVHLGTATADGSGVAVLEFTVQEGTELGAHALQASGLNQASQPATAETTIVVVAAQAPIPDVLGGDTVPGGAVGQDLAKTGSDSSLPLTRVAAALIAVGGIAVLTARRSREHEVV